MAAVCVVLVLAAAGLAAAAGGGVESYTIPAPLFEALNPTGLRVSIPDEPGMREFLFYGNVNQPMKTLQDSQLYGDVLRPKNGRWVFEDPRVSLKANDIVHYWLKVYAFSNVYIKAKQKWVVTGLVDPGGSTPSVVRPSEPLLGDCGATVTRVNGKPSCRGRLVFEENFDGIDYSKWSHDIRIAGSPEYEFVAYTRNGENCHTRNGFLLIKPTLLSNTKDITKDSLQLEGCTGLRSSGECTKKAVGWDILPPVLSARLRTRDSFSFQYGYVEVRAKLPSGDWIFPEVWLEPKNGAYGREYASGQVRLALSRGNRDLTRQGTGSAAVNLGSRRLEAGCILGLEEKVRKELGSWDKQSSGWCDNFHVYSLEWTPDHMLFSVDGQQVNMITPPEGGFSSLPDFNGASQKPWARGSKMAPFDKEFYVTLGLGVGGVTEFPDNCLTSLPSGSYHPKPWKNTGFNAMLSFWKDRKNWQQSWDFSGDSSALQVDYVKVWAL